MIGIGYIGGLSSGSSRLLVSCSGSLTSFFVSTIILQSIFVCASLCVYSWYPSTFVMIGNYPAHPFHGLLYTVSHTVDGGKLSDNLGLFPPPMIEFCSMWWFICVFSTFGELRVSYPPPVL